jgi:hypothetical protein
VALIIRFRRFGGMGMAGPGNMDRYADRLDTAADEVSKAKISPNETGKAAASETSSP